MGRVGGCCRCVGAFAVIPLAILVAVLMEKPVLIEFPLEEHDTRAEIPDNAREAAPAPASLHPGSLGPQGMFDNIAFVYDATNVVMSLGLHQTWKRALVQDCMQLQRGDRVLDLATGTADVGLLLGQRLKELGAEANDAVLGIDPSAGMLQHGVVKVGTQGLKGYVRLVKGDAQDLSSVQDVDAEGTLSTPSDGVADASVDKVSMSFGIRNVPDRQKALKEIKRVLVNKLSSRICILDASLPDGDGILSQIARSFVTKMLPFIGKVATLGRGSDAYAYLERSIVDFPNPTEFASEMARVGIRVKTITRFAFGSVNLFMADVAEE